MEVQFVPVRIEQAIITNRKSNMIPHPIPVQEHPRPIQIYPVTNRKANPT